MPRTGGAARVHVWHVRDSLGHMREAVSRSAFYEHPHTAGASMRTIGRQGCANFGRFL